MICLICRQADIADGLTSIHFERGELKMEVKAVPAQVCPNCGEAYVEAEIAAQLLMRAEEVSAQELAGDLVVSFADLKNRPLSH